MHLKRLFNTEFGKIILSMILGIGLASIFRKVCNGRDCIEYNGPVISDIEGKIFKHDGKCYKYNYETKVCDAEKETIDISDGNK
jgi:hypothetical protein